MTMFRIFLTALIVLAADRAGVDGSRAIPGVASDEPSFPSLFDGVVSKAKTEWASVKERVGQVREKVLTHLVFHRGFHSFAEVPDLPEHPSKVRPLSRPIENTVAAFSATWTMGVDLCECDVALTADKELVLFHNDTIARFRDSSASDRKRVRHNAIGEVSSTGLQNQLLVSADAFEEDPLDAEPKRLRSWFEIPTLYEALKAASEIGENKKLVVEIKADDATAAETGAAMATWVTQNRDLSKHIAVIMSFAEAALLSYHNSEGMHGPGDDVPTLMLLTVKAEGVDKRHQENKVSCDDGKTWTPTAGWTKPAHLDGLYMEVTIRDQTRWISEVKTKCENDMGMVLGAWTFPGDPHLLAGGHVDEAGFEQTLNAADVEESTFFLVDRMGFSYSNTDFPEQYFSKGYMTLQNRATKSKRLQELDMGWPAPSE